MKKKEKLQKEEANNRAPLTHIQQIRIETLNLKEDAEEYIIPTNTTSQE